MRFVAVDYKGAARACYLCACLPMCLNGVNSEAMCAAWTSPHVAFSSVLGNIVVWPMLAAMAATRWQCFGTFDLVLVFR